MMVDCQVEEAWRSIQLIRTLRMQVEEMELDPFFKGTQRIMLDNGALHLFKRLRVSDIPVCNDAESRVAEVQPTLPWTLSGIVLRGSIINILSDECAQPMARGVTWT